MTEPAFEPYADRIVIEVIEPEKESAGGVIIPDLAQERPQRGTVVSVGLGARNETTGERMPIGVKPGDVVLFSKYGGMEVPFGDNLLLIREADVLAVDPAEVAF